MLLRDSCASYQHEKRFLQTPCRVQRGMGVLDTSSTIMAPTTGINSRSDLACSRQCVEQPVCTAWTFTPKGSRSGTCDMFAEHEVMFSASKESGMVSGTRCEAAPLTIVSDENEYRYYAEGKTWDEAQVSCHQLGAGYELLITKSDAEVAFVKDTLLGGGIARDVWIGCRDNGENMFTWIDGTPCGAGISGTSWKPSEPNFSSESHGCARYDASDERYRWADHRCDYSLPYICKRPNRTPAVVEGTEVTFAMSYIEAEDRGLWWSSPKPWGCAADRLVSTSGNCDLDLSTLHETAVRAGDSLRADGFKIMCPVHMTPSRDENEAHSSVPAIEFGSGDSENPTVSPTKSPSTSPTKSPTYSERKSRCVADAAVLTKLVGNGVKFKCAHEYGSVISHDNQYYMYLDECEANVRFLNAFVLSTTYSATAMSGIVPILPRARAPGAGQCPRRYPFAYRSSHAFDRCCSTAIDGDGCGQGAVMPNYVECPSPPCSDYFISPAEVMSPAYDVVFYSGETTKEPILFAKGDKARVIRVVGGAMEVRTLPLSEAPSSFWAPVTAVTYDSTQDPGAPTIQSVRCRKGCLPGFHEERHHDDGIGPLRMRRHPGVDYTSVCKPGVCAGVCKRCFGSLSNCTSCRAQPFPILVADGAGGYTCRAVTPTSAATVTIVTDVASAPNATPQGVSGGSGDDDGDGSDGFMVAFIIVLLLLIGVAAAAAVLFVKQKRDEQAASESGSVNTDYKTPVTAFEPSYDASVTPVNSPPSDMYIEVQEPTEEEAKVKAAANAKIAAATAAKTEPVSARHPVASGAGIVSETTDPKAEAPVEPVADKSGGISRDRQGSVYTGFGNQENAYYNQGKAEDGDQKEGAEHKQTGGSISRNARQGSVYNGFATVDDPDANEGDDDDDDEDAPLDF